MKIVIHAENSHEMPSLILLWKLQKINLSAGVLYFSKKIKRDILYELSARQKIHMNCQS